MASRRSKKKREKSLLLSSPGRSNGEHKRDRWGVLVSGRETEKGRSAPLRGKEKEMEREEEKRRKEEKWAVGSAVSGTKEEREWRGMGWTRKFHSIGLIQHMNSNHSFEIRASCDPME